MHGEKIKLVKEIIGFALEQPYEPDKFSKYVYAKSLDRRPYRYGDRELNRLLDILVGMSAGEEFRYSKEEVVEMLQSYVSSLERRG